MIEDLRKKERKRSRSTFMPVASNPSLYSQTQLANFLNGRFVKSCSLSLFVFVFVFLFVCICICVCICIHLLLLYSFF